MQRRIVVIEPAFFLVALDGLELNHQLVQFVNSDRFDLFAHKIQGEVAPSWMVVWPEITFVVASN